MEWGQRARGVLLRPLLVQLTGWRATPDMITLIAALMGLAFLPLWLLGSPVLALTMLWGHVLLDGLDGPLARYQRSDSSRGSFTDTFADQLVVTAVMLAWMIQSPGSLNIAVGTVYVFLYGLVVAMAMVRNALLVPYSWLVRPRFFVFASLTLDCWLATEFTLLVLGICNLLLALKSFSGFLALRQHLAGPDCT